MERLNTHVGSVQTALERRPEVLKAVGVNAFIDLVNCAVNNLVSVVAGKTLLGKRRLGVWSRTSFYVLANFSLKNMLAAALDNRSAKLTTTLMVSLDGTAFILKSAFAGYAQTQRVYETLHPSPKTTDSTSRSNRRSSSPAFSSRCFECVRCLQPRPS
jgi:hypothetical protein